MSSRFLLRSVLLLVLAVVAWGLVGTRPIDPPAGQAGPDEWTPGEAAGPMIVARAIDRTPAAARLGALAAVALAAAGLAARRIARPLTPVPGDGARAGSEALRTPRRRGPPAGRAR